MKTTEDMARYVHSLSYADVDRSVIERAKNLALSSLGSAILGAVASGHHTDFVAAMSAMSEIGEVYRPGQSSAAVHDKRFRAFELLQQTARAIRRGDARGQ